MSVKSQLSRAVRGLSAGLVLAVCAAAVPGTSTAQSITGTLTPAKTHLAPQIRRILNRLETLIKDENAEVSAARTKALRRSVQMLVFRAKTSGYKLNVVADALKASATERFGRKMPGAFAAADGQLDARALIRGIIGKTATTGVVRQDKGYLSAITREGNATVVGASKTVEPDVADAQKKPAPDPNGIAETVQEKKLRNATKARVRTVAGKKYIVVQQGDTLGSLARDLYGDMLQFRKIYDANRQRITNPNVISPGIRLIVP